MSSPYSTVPRAKFEGASEITARTKAQPKVRKRLEVVIPLKRNRPAYQATGISLGCEAEVEEGDHAPQSSQPEATSPERAGSIDWDLDLASPSSCVTSSCSSDSEEDDLCSIDGTDMTEYPEGTDFLGCDGDGDDDDDDSKSGKVSHVSCSVDENDAEDQTDLKQFRSSAPSPPIFEPPPPFLQGIPLTGEQPVNVLGPLWPANSNVKLEDGESRFVLNCTVPSLAQITSSKSHMASPSGESSSMPLIQPTVDAPKARKYRRLQLEVSIPRPSSRKRTASAQTGNASRIDVREDRQPCQLDNSSHEKDDTPGIVEPGRSLKRKLGAPVDDHGVGHMEREREENSGNDLDNASSSALKGCARSASEHGHGMRDTALEEEREQIQDATKSKRWTGALTGGEDVKEVDVKEEDIKMDLDVKMDQGVKVDVKNEDVKMEAPPTVFNRKGKAKEVAATNSSSISGRASTSDVKVEARGTMKPPKVEEGMNLERNEKTDQPLAQSTPARIAVPTIASSSIRTPRNIPPEATKETGGTSTRHGVQAGASTTALNVVDPRNATTSPSSRPSQLAPPQPGTIPIDKVLAKNSYDSRGRPRPKPLRIFQRDQRAPNPVLAFPPRAVVGYVPTHEEVDNIYLHLQLASLVPWRSPSNEINGAFQHGDNLWNRVLHPNMGRILREQTVPYPNPESAPTYPPEADVVKFQFDKWGAEARVASYKACILGGSDSDARAMKCLLDRKFGGNLSLEYSSFLLQVLASKLDAFGRLGMVDRISPCRILSANSLERGVIDRDFGELLAFCSRTPSTKVMAGWFDCQGKVSTYSYNFENRSLKIYNTGGGVYPLFQTYVQVLLDCFTIILELPPYDIDLELLHLAPHAIPKEEGPIAIIVLELLVSGRVPQHCLPNMQMTEDRLAVWIPSICLQHAQYLLDDHAAFKLLDKKLQSLRRMMDG